MGGNDLTPLKQHNLGTTPAYFDDQRIGAVDTGERFPDSVAGSQIGESVFFNSLNNLDIDTGSYGNPV